MTETDAALFLGTIRTAGSRREAERLIGGGKRCILAYPDY